MTHYRMDDPHNPPPRDGTLFDLWRPDGSRRINWSWSNNEAKWIQRHGSGGCTLISSLDGFTHWSPIVPPGDEPQEPARDLMVAYDDGSCVGAWYVFEQTSRGDYAKVDGPFASSETANAAMAQILAEDEPQESTIRWHGPEVAETWPQGSIVLIDQTSDGIPFFEVFTIEVQRHVQNYPPHWRYALIKRGAQESTGPVRRGGPFDDVSEIKRGGE